MSLILALRYWAQITIAFLCLLLLFAVSSCSSKAKEIKTLKVEHELAITIEQATSLALLNESERINNERWQHAVNENTKAQKQIADSYASNNAIVGSLSDTIDKASANYIKADADSRAKYALALANVSKECIGEITAMARITDGHVADIIMLQKAWSKR